MKAANYISTVEAAETLSDQVVPSDGELDVVIDLAKYECLFLYILIIYQ